MVADHGHAASAGFVDGGGGGADGAGQGRLPLFGGAAGDIDRGAGGAQGHGDAAPGAAAGAGDHRHAVFQ